jgi:hypothetical protein
MAADQLLGGLIGIPGGWLEGIRRRNELRRDARERFLEADIAAALRQVEGLSELGQTTMRRFLRDEYRKQENRASVWAAAEEQFTLPPPDEAVGDTSAAEEATAAIDPDWLNRFTSFAQDVSSEELQRVWGRVLAGEIRKPGSFSISSLRVLAELEADVARWFEETYRKMIGGYVLRPQEFEGDVLERCATLENAGLVQADGFLNYEIRRAPDGFGYLFGEKYLLKVIYGPNVQQVTFPAIRITRVGMQLGTILLRDEALALREIAQVLKPVEKVELCVITARAGERVWWNVLETLPLNQ